MTPLRPLPGGGRRYRIPKDPVFVLGLGQHLANKPWTTATWLHYAIERIAAACGWQIHPWLRRFRMNSRACIAAVALVLRSPAGTRGGRFSGRKRHLGLWPSRREGTSVVGSNKLAGRPAPALPRRSTRRRRRDDLSMTNGEGAGGRGATG